MEAVLPRCGKYAHCSRAAQLESCLLSHDSCLYFPSGVTGAFTGLCETSAGGGDMAHFAVDFGGAFAVQVDVYVWDGQRTPEAFHLGFAVSFTEDIHHDGSGCSQARVAQRQIGDGANVLLELRSTVALYGVVAAVVDARSDFVYQHFPAGGEEHLYAVHAGTFEEVGNGDGEGMRFFGDCL